MSNVLNLRKPKPPKGGAAPFEHDDKVVIRVEADPPYAADEVLEFAITSGNARVNGTETQVLLAGAKMMDIAITPGGKKFEVTVMRVGTGRKYVFKFEQNKKAPKASVPSPVAPAPKPPAEPWFRIPMPKKTAAAIASPPKDWVFAILVMVIGLTLGVAASTLWLTTGFDKDGGALIEPVGP